MELMRMRSQCYLVYLLFPFPLNPRLDKVFGKDVALGEELMVFFECIHCFFEGAGRLLGLGQLFLGKLVHVHVHRLAGVEFAFDAVVGCHKHRGESKIAVAARVRATEFNAFCLRIR